MADHELAVESTVGGWQGRCKCSLSSPVETARGRVRRWHQDHVMRDLDPDLPSVHTYLAEKRSTSLPTVELDQLEVVIAQTEARIELWEKEALRAERRWHRGVRTVDQRGLTKAENIFDALWEVAEDERLWVPDERLRQDTELLKHLYEVRQQLLTGGQ